MLASPLRRAAAFAALLTLFLLAWERFAASWLYEAELERFDTALEAAARAVADVVEGAGPELSAQRWAELAVHAGASAGLRVSVIGPDGRVLADSGVAPDHLPDIESHADRPEVRQAEDAGVGRASRRSQTVGRELYYVAVPVSGGRIVRVAQELRVLEQRVALARGHALGLIGIAALVSIGIIYAFLWLFHQRPLQEMRRMAGEIAGGRLDVRLPPTSPDADVDQLARVINKIAAQLRARLRDVTREKEQLGAVLEGMVEGVLVVDERGVILLANPRLRELFDLSAEIEGRPLLEGVRNTDIESILAKAAHTRETVARTVTLAGPSPRTLQAVAAPLPREGERVGTVAVFHDVSEVLRLEGVRRDFVANASHELRTPLAAIRGFAETLLDASPLSPEDQKSYLGVIHRHAQRLSAIVEDLLELSTIESRTLKLEIAPVNVRDVAENLIADSRLRAEERNLAVSLHVEGQPMALADARALDQVLGNLLDNAMKYTERGGTIEVRIEETPQRIRVRVIDSGIGIPAGDTARIFERFYRVDKARSRSLGGTGLGLSIVKHLVQTMRGEILVESELDRGSTFTFTVPNAAAAEGEASPARA